MNNRKQKQMHYKNGREVKHGDKLIAHHWDGTPYTGVVIGINPQSPSCNLTIAPFNPSTQTTVTAKECLHVDDALPKQPVRADRDDRPPQPERQNG
jgi:hypothetical protein